MRNGAWDTVSHHIGGNRLVERFHSSLKYELLYQREIAAAADLAEKAAANLLLCNETRPYATLARRGRWPCPALRRTVKVADSSAALAR